MMDERTPHPARRLRPLLTGWAPVAVWASLIFVLSAQADLRFVPDAGLDFVVRKIGHMGVFGILAVLSWRALAITTTWPRPWALAFGITVLYATSDELHQGLVAGRDNVGHQYALASPIGILASGGTKVLCSSDSMMRRYKRWLRTRDRARHGSA